ncbi:hypothetical protein BTO00_15095 [Vibrio campbellii]|uniref:EAL domain-containing protein n=1 Tax=Vibrio campbellii TaxID=680 RepID=UPI000D420BE4|nr:EAL domain-containing protein [Vibrio campbellii]PQJ43315.1 hypothetical protein BTO00_15095 [Vibrio campbellii]
MTKNICSKTDVPGWIVLLVLITGFIFAYAAFLHEIINKPVATLLETGLALLLLGGSIFVVLVIKCSNDSIHELHAVAERSNQVHNITMWVLDQVERDLLSLIEQGIRLPVHVNLSAKALSSNLLFSRLEQMLSDNPSFENLISLEITETMAIDRVLELNPLINQIKGLGIKISLDDFGTGYSSLSLLRDLPVDQIKIDRSFLSTASKTEGPRSIVENTIALAHGLGYSVVAEGVQDMDTLHFLRSRGCDIIQGYLFCPALPLNEVINWVNNHDEEQTRIRRA